MDPLDGAYERVSRSREHLADLKSRIEEFCKAQADNVVVERHPEIITMPDGNQKRVVVGTATFKPLQVPLRISVLVGEAIYNMRAALDYLVYELAGFDAKRIVERTQFPIEESEQVFDMNRRSSYLKGVSDEHVALIKNLQPFKGCQWTKALQSISNPDKHMHLVPAAGPVTVATKPGSTEAILTGKTVDVQTDITVDVTFYDGMPVVEQLEQLVLMVTQTLDVFKPELK